MPAAALLSAGNALAQNCPPIDAEQQKATERECRAAGGEWSRFGVLDALCGIYRCAPRTKDSGKPCRNRTDCEHLCVTDAPPKIGAEAQGKCTGVVTSFGCHTYVDDGKIVGRVCVE
jgi:hypothetical protein